MCVCMSTYKHVCWYTRGQPTAACTLLPTPLSMAAGWATIGENMNREREIGCHKSKELSYYSKLIGCKVSRGIVNDVKQVTLADHWHALMELGGQHLSQAGQNQLIQWNFFTLSIETWKISQPIGKPSLADSIHTI